MPFRDKVCEEITRVVSEELPQGAVETEAVLGLSDRGFAGVAHGAEYREKKL
jgi:hypothetical protein